MRKGFLVLLVLLGFAWAEDTSYLNDSKERERFGLSPDEYESCRILGIGKVKLKTLLLAGITIQEYSQAPWYSLGVTEDEWIKQRRNGEVDVNIKNSSKSADPDEGLVVISCLLPGYGQFKLDKKPLGYALSGVAGLSLSMSFLFPKKIQTNTGIRKRWHYEYLGFYLASGILSGFDVWRQTKYENNPELERFSFNAETERPGIQMRYCF